MEEKLWVDHIYDKKGKELNINIGDKNTKSSLSTLGSEFLKPSDLTTFLVYTLIGGTNYNTLSQGNIADILGTTQGNISRESSPLNKLIKKGYIEKTQIGNNITHSNNKYKLKKEKPFNFNWSIFLNLPNTQNVKSKALGLYLLIRSDYKVNNDNGVNYGVAKYRTSLKELKALYHDTSNNNDKIAEYLSYLIDNNLIRIHLNKEDNSRFMILFPQEKVYKIESLKVENEEFSKIPAKISEIVSVPEKKEKKCKKCEELKIEIERLNKELENVNTEELEELKKDHEELHGKFRKLLESHQTYKDKYLYELEKRKEFEYVNMGLNDRIEELEAEIEKLKSIPNSITQQEIVTNPDTKNDMGYDISDIDISDFDF